MDYFPKKIEAKWLKAWLKNKVYEPDLKKAKRPFYNLMMFPYPSAEGLHIGAVRTFSGVDIYGRLKRMQGYDVFEPMGLDGFGIHSENYALKIGKHPIKHAKDSEENFYRQLHLMGNGFAWSEKVETYSPDYYKWTQWIFTEFFRRGLAYRAKSKVNWCPSCLTVLADEQVIAGECERCGSKVLKKDLEQWFFRITKYADRLLANIEKLDWSEKVKIAQRNWIGRSEGAEIEFQVKNHESRIKVFTTRPDTLFGATYVVLGPEHSLLANSKLQIANRKEVDEYIKKAKSKTDEERVEEGKDPSTGSGREKTGVELKGVKAINPANNEELPIWVADYVLGNVGTGAIMAVPAHDERDFEFAQKMGLPIRPVIRPVFVDLTNPPQKGKRHVFRKMILAVLRNPKTGHYLTLKWKKRPWRTFVTGGVDEDEDAIGAAQREIIEETGYTNTKFVRSLGIGQAHYFAAHKDANHDVHVEHLLFDLVDEKSTAVLPEEKEQYDVEWLTLGELKSSKLQHAEAELLMHRIVTGKDFYTGSGTLANSGEFNDRDNEEAKWAITAFVKGKRTVQYRLRDWLVSRQRYWGPPIPMIFCQNCFEKNRGEQSEQPGWYAVPEKQLPVRLPYVKNFRPTGTGVSPLASVKSFYETKCPACKSKARRETDVSDAFLDSAWYFLRYPSAKDKQHAWTPDITKKWLPVHKYIGGAEHSVLHLLYSRFVAMAFRDAGLLQFEEPFTVFRAHGLITKDGAKMSKSKGNVVNPDEYINTFGVDAIRMYLAFLAPFEQSGDFRDSGIAGMTRFLNRVWKLYDIANRKSQIANRPKIQNEKIDRVLHQTIKKVTEDIESLHYNTAISALMVLLNLFEENQEALTLEHKETFLKLLAPLAPFITEELFQSNKKQETRDKKFRSIHLEKWPEYDPKLLEETHATVVIQVNGRYRDRVEVNKDISEGELKHLVFSQEKIKQLIPDEKKVKKFIYIKGRLVNLVI